MRPSNSSLLSILALLAILGLCFPLFNVLLSGSNNSQQVSIDEINAERQCNSQLSSLRLESWGECFQAAPNLLVAVSSRMSDQAGRARLRRLWRKKWRLNDGAAQLVFFVRCELQDFKDSRQILERDKIVEEFHRRQDLMLNAALNWQTDAAMLRAATAWYLDRCPRTPYLLFVGADGGTLQSHESELNVRLVALNTAGGGVGGALASLPRRQASEPVQGVRNVNATSGSVSNTTSNGNQHQPACLLLPRPMAENLARRVTGSETDWLQLQHLLQPEFAGWVKDARDLFCQPD